MPDGCTKIYRESTQGLSKVTNIASEELCDSDGVAELYKSGQAALGLRTSANPKPKPILDKTGAPAPVHLEPATATASSVWGNVWGDSGDLQFDGSSDEDGSDNDGSGASSDGESGKKGKKKKKKTTKKKGEDGKEPKAGNSGKGKRVTAESSEHGSEKTPPAKKLKSDPFAFLGKDLSKETRKPAGSDGTASEKPVVLTEDTASAIRKTVFEAKEVIRVLPVANKLLAMKSVALEKVIEHLQKHQSKITSLDGAWTEAQCRRLKSFVFCYLLRRSFPEMP